MRVIYEPKGPAREYSPLACNLYRGCTHGCVYCYAPNVVQKARSEFHGASTPRVGIVREVEKDATEIAGTDKPVLFCFTCDPYQAAHADDRTTRLALQWLRAFDVPAQILTKGGLLATRDFDVLASMRAWFGTTLVCSEEKSRQHWEPNAATIESRIAAIKEAHALGVPTWVSVEPVLYLDQALSLIEELSPWVDEWRIGKLNYHSHAKTIAWRQAAPRLLQAAIESGRRYLMKDSLLPYLSQAEREQAVKLPPTPQFQGATRSPQAAPGTLPYQAKK